VALPVAWMIVEVKSKKALICALWCNLAIIDDADVLGRDDRWHATDG
jgi:hypothetical protein